MIDKQVRHRSTFVLSSDGDQTVTVRLPVFRKTPADVVMS